MSKSGPPVAVLALAAALGATCLASGRVVAGEFDDRNLQQYLELHLPPPDVSPPPSDAEKPKLRKARKKKETVEERAKKRRQ